MAAAHYASLGYAVLERNWRCPAGELDLVVARPGPGAPVVFVEVKTRSGPAFGTPLESVTPAKQRRSRRAAVAWLARWRGSTDAGRPRCAGAGRPWAALRFDVVGVVRHRDGSATLEVVEDAY